MKHFVLNVNAAIKALRQQESVKITLTKEKKTNLVQVITKDLESPKQCIFREITFDISTLSDTHLVRQSSEISYLRTRFQKQALLQLLEYNNDSKGRWYEQFLV